MSDKVEPILLPDSIEGGARRLTVPSPSLPSDPEYWKKRAEEVRTQAEEMNDAHSKILMLGTAEIYEKIAKSYENLATWKQHQRSLE